MEKKRRLSYALPLAVGMLMAGSGNAFALPAQSAAKMMATQQNGQVKGVVTDSHGEPLVGVSVVVKGNNKLGTVTNLDGEFAINAPNGATLVVSYVGYVSKEVVVNGGTLNVTLQEDSEALDEVVVIGYGVVRKADLAGSVATMDNKAFRDQPITQVSDALQGRVAGVNVVSDGTPGGSVKIRIRGANSINKSNDPLYVVDGMVRESGLEGINPEDIQSMQILKDASSTAIYGSRGANGVVIITTKTGNKGESRITFDASFGIAEATRLPKVMDSRTYAQALVDYAGQPQNELADYISGKNPGVDWIDAVFRTGYVQNYKVAVSRGSESVQSYFSGNYMKNEGVIEASSYERYSAKANFKADVTKWFAMTLDMNASHTVGHGIGGMEMGGYNPLWGTFNYSPSIDMFDKDGNYNVDPYGSISGNPYASVAGGTSDRIRNVFNGHIDLVFHILPGLTFTSSNGVDYQNSNTYGFTPYIASAPNKNSMSNNNNQRMLLQSSNNLTWVKDWNKKHFLTATAVWEATKSETRTMGISGKDLQAEAVGYWDVNNAATRECSNGYSDWAMLSGVGRVMYNYDNRYMVTGTFRADGSSRFMKNKWGYFPSIAAAWTVSNEKFMESTRDVISNLKIRASYGVIGNQDITPYSTLGLLGQATAYFGTNNAATGYWISAISTPDLKWEKTNQFDFGFDMSLLNGRIDLSVDYFNKKTTDALLSTKQANYLGGASYLINAGEVSNRGIDVAVTAHVVESKDFSYTTTINGSFVKNKVEKLTAAEPMIYGGEIAGVVKDATIVKEGEAIGTFYGYEWAGIDKDGFDTYLDETGKAVRDPKTDARRVLGKASPDFTLGWNNSLRYKNWSLNAFFNSSFGAKRLNALRFSMNSMIGNSRMFTDAGFIGEIGNTMPNPKVANNQYIANSSKWIESADYFRCENITLAYDFNKSVTKFADIRLSFSVQNLFTLTGYKGANPAGFSFAGEGDRSNGIDTGTYPTPRTFTFGARINF